MLRNRLGWQSKNKERLLDFLRSITFLQSHKEHRYYITKVGHWRKDVLEGHALFCFKIFSAKDVCTMNVTFFTLICIWNRARSVSFKTVGRVVDRDIIFRDRTYLVFFSLAAWSAGTRSLNPGNRVCVLFSLSFCLFLYLLTFSIFSPLPLLIKLVKKAGSASL